MRSFRLKNAARLVPVLVALGAAGCSAAGAHSSPEPLRCEISAGMSGGMFALQGVVHSDGFVTGSYRLTVAGTGGGGRTNISQGGAFEAVPGQPTMLGNVMLGANGQAYDVRLEVEAAGGRRVACSDVVSLRT